MANPNAAELAFAIQSAKGSPSASSTERIYLVGGAQPSPGKVAYPSNSVATTRISEGPIVDSIRPAGSPEFIVRPESIGALLYAVLGAKSVTGAADPWTHTFTLGTSLPYMTFWRHSAGVLNERLSDTRVARLVLSGGSGQPLRGVVDVVGGAAHSRSAQETTAVAEAPDPLLFRHGAGALKIEGTAVSSISNFTLTVNAGVAVVETLAGPMPFLSGLASITLDAEQALVDASLWNRLLYGSASPANLTAATITPLELAGSPAGIEFTFTEQAAPERSLRLALPRVAVLQPTGFDPDPTYGTGRMGVTYQAFKPASGSPLTATLKNAVSAY